MNLSYRQKLFFYFGILFCLFAGGIVVFEQAREKTTNIRILEERLETYIDILNEEIPAQQSEISQHINVLENLFPDELRISIISSEGVVKYDNSIENLSRFDNHLQRPEIQRAETSGKGSDIRTSETNQQEYLYFVKKYDDFYIRAALPYSHQIRQFLKPDNGFLYFILFFFGLFLFLIHILTKRFGTSIRQLRDFALQTKEGEFQSITFSSDELGEIGTTIAENYQQLKESQKQNEQERQKLLQHIQVLEEGICFLSPQKEIEFYNALFIQYLNTLSDEPNSEPQTVLTDPAFSAIQKFLEKGKSSFFETTLRKHGKTFSARVNRFDDNSFEIILNDITKKEKTEKLKKEMTGNIAHELRTPVTSIRGYLETVLNLPIDEEKKKYFIEKAFNQTVVLSDLISDMSLLAKIDEVSEDFALEKVNVFDIVQSLKEENQKKLSDKNSNFQIDIPQHLYIVGNKSLLTSIFRNLLENALRYGGEHIEIGLRLQKEETDFYYFSFYDTGFGIPNEKRLNRIFERFFRLNEGRTRDSGGSGLGLSIVKNAVQFHHGKISVKNRKEGGLEFLFSLKK